jgi:hypothetical protein
VRGIKRGDAIPLFIGQAQVEHRAEGDSSTFCQLDKRYSIRLNREGPLSGQDTIGSIP